MNHEYHHLHISHVTDFFSASVLFLHLPSSITCSDPPLIHHDYFSDSGNISDIQKKMCEAQWNAQQLYGTGLKLHEMAKLPKHQHSHFCRETLPLDVYRAHAVPRVIPYN
jgi:hypothetical protein